MLVELFKKKKKIKRLKKHGARYDFKIYGVRLPED